MPSEEVFLSSIGADSYRHRAYSLETPEEHRYRWKSSPPPVSQLTIAMYDTISGSEDRVVPIHQLLGIKEALSTPENMRVHVYQVIIGCMMAYYGHGYSLRALETVPNAEEIPTDLVELGRFLVALAIRPMAYTQRSTFFTLRYRIEHGSDGVVWPLPRTCLLITTHLDDDHNFKAAIMKLMDAAKDRTKFTQGTIHGIAFSFYHCAVVRVHNEDGDFVMSHTPALQFLPSFYATSPSTSGITALVRLGCALQTLSALGLDRHCISQCDGGILRSMDWMEEALRQPSLCDLLTLAKNKESFKSASYDQWLKGGRADDIPMDLGKLSLTFWMQVTSRLNLSSVDDILIPLKIKPPQTILDRVPLEVWMHIASYVFCGDSLLTLAELTPPSWYAANEFLKFPHIGRHRIIGVHKIDPAAWSRELVGDENFLWSASFQTSCRRSKKSRYQDTDRIILTQTTDSRGFASGPGRGVSTEGNLRDAWTMTSLSRELDSFSCWAPTYFRILRGRISSTDNFDIFCGI